MRLTIFILTLAAFLQTTIVPINLVLILLICRSFLSTKKSNLFLAFIFGLLVDYLTLNTLGFQSIIFLVLIQITQIISKTRFSMHSLLIVPFAFILLFVNALMLSFANNQSVQILPKILIESMLSLPIFYLIRFWSGRFVVQRDIKLKF